MRRSRRGFALSLVLWMIVGVAALGMGLVTTGRSSLRATTNRVLLARGAWVAEGCIEVVRAVVDDTLLSPAEAAEGAWRALDTIVVQSPLLAGCDLDVRPAGAVLDVNMASAVQLSLVVRSLGASVEQADSVADAILDWRDADDLARASGAEASWYRERALLSPRNGPIAAPLEISRIRGVSSISGVDLLLGVEPGRILIGRASAEMLAALPGFGPEAVARGTMFATGRSLRDLLDFSAMLSPPARAELLAHFAELQQHVTLSPDAWIITARAAVGRPAVASFVEVRMVRAGTRAAIVRHRSGP